jgi:tRNA(Ile)-lysidine synthetase-like protein
MAGSMSSNLKSAVATVPAGAWAIGVSGGADSVACLRLLRDRPDLSLHVVHLDHETRGAENVGDARFVQDLAQHLDVPITTARRSEIERNITKLPSNLSARFRAARMELFKQVVAAHKLNGVILAHHADDQAETILQRLIRGSPATALAGMSSRANVAGLRILRPLLNVHSGELREYLDEISQPWREDSSNISPKYLRNQLRLILVNDVPLRDSLLELGKSCGELKTWLAAATPKLSEQFLVEDLALPSPIAGRAAGRWLVKRGSPIDQITSTVCDRLIVMAADAASPARQHFPGGLLVRRRKGTIFVDGPTQQ